MSIGASQRLQDLLLMNPIVIADKHMRTLPITHVSRGSPMIRHLINNRGTRNVTTDSFRRIVVRSEKQYHSEIPLTDKYPNQQHPPADRGA